MSRVILCIGNYAENPYYIESAALSIYSMEELCFYLYENAYLLDKNTINKKLIEWIAQECGLKELSKDLLLLYHKKSTISIFVITILGRMYYCPQPELEELEKVIKESDSMNVLEKKKTAADYFAKRGKILHALNEYEKLVVEIGKSDEFLLSKVFHNIGTIYASMFEFEKAAEYFLHSYELSFEHKTYLSYLYAKRLDLKEEDYIRFITENPKNYQFSLEVEKKIEHVMAESQNYEPRMELQELKACKNSRRAAEYYTKVDEMINQWKEIYRSYVEKE